MASSSVIRAGTINTSGESVWSEKEEEKVERILQQLATKEGLIPDHSRRLKDIWKLSYAQL